MRCLASAFLANSTYIAASGIQNRNLWIASPQPIHCAMAAHSCAGCDIVSQVCLHVSIVTLTLTHVLTSLVYTSCYKILRQVIAF